MSENEKELTPAQTRAALIEKKRKAGLTKDQAEQVADAQIAHDAELAKAKNKPAKAK